MVKAGSLWAVVMIWHVCMEVWHLRLFQEPCPEVWRRPPIIVAMLRKEDGERGEEVAHGGEEGRDRWWQGGEKARKRSKLKVLRQLLRGDVD